MSSNNDSTTNTRALRHALMLAGMALACWAVAIGLLWLAVQIIVGIWHHPIGGGLIAGAAAIAVYVGYCIRRGITL